MRRFYRVWTVDSRVMSGDMFVRTSSRRNKDGTKVSYLQLAHNQWDPATRTSKMRVLYNFGRAEQVDRAGIERLIASLSRLVDAPVLPSTETSATDAGLSFTESQPLGGAWARRAVEPARDRRLDDQAVGQVPSRRPAHRAGAVRAGREPGAGAVVEAGRRFDTTSTYFETAREARQGRLRCQRTFCCCQSVANCLRAPRRRRPPDSRFRSSGGLSQW